MKVGLVVGLLVIAVFTAVAEAGSISGSVTDSAGTPVSGVKVTLLDASTLQPTDYTGITGEDGGFSIADVSSGRYYVRADPAGDRYLPGQSLEAVELGDVMGVKIELSARPSSSATYVGVEKCGMCHPDKKQSWQSTLHAKALRTVDPSKHGIPGEGVVGDFGERGVGKDITLSDSEHENVKIHLLFDGEKYTATIGDITYDIIWTMGGSGFKKQRYVTQIGVSHYILPMQWNEETKQWVPYHLDNWFKTDGSPLYAGSRTPLTEGRQADSWERRCAGCHATTGLSLKRNANGEYVADYVDLSISCESCHGPGSEHAGSGGGRANHIVRPDLLTYERAGEVCGQCHSRGTARVSMDESHKFPYPWNGATGNVSEGYQPGEPLDQYYQGYTMEDNSKGYFWSVKQADPDYNLGAGDAFAAKRHHEQWPELAGRSKHSRNPQGLVNCFNCHDSHGSGNDMLVEQSNGKPVKDVVDLCLSCHQDDSPFNGKRSHLTGKFTVMDKIGVKCTDCHMPDTAKSASTTSFSAPQGDLTLGDIASHTFQPLRPRWSGKNSKPEGAPDSCNREGCHSDKTDSDYQELKDSIEKLTLEGPSKTPGPETPPAAKETPALGAAIGLAALVLAGAMHRKKR